MGVVEYTLGHDQISQTTIPYSSGTPGTPEPVFFAVDGHGSVRMLLDMAGAIATIAGMRQLFLYDAYGNAVGFNMAAAATTFLYSGEQFDPRIGQQYLRARYYDPATGRFNRLDPFFGNLNDPQSFHKYLYTHANPINGIDPTGEFSLTGVLSALGINLNNFSMQAAFVYTAKQTAWAILETGFEFLAGKLLSLLTSVPFNPTPQELARTFGTNLAVNLATAGLGKVNRLRHLIDWAFRTFSDVVIGGENVMWSAAVNAISLATGEMLSKYGKEIFGVCISKFGGCFVAGTPVVVDTISPDAQRVAASDATATVVECRSRTVTISIEEIPLGSRVFTEAQEDQRSDDPFGDPDQATWRKVTLVQHRSNGAEIEMELLRPQWFVELLNLRPGTQIDFDVPELDSVGTARILAVDECPPIEAGNGRVVVGRFVSRRVTNLVAVTLEDDTRFVGTTTHPVWSVDRNEWRRIDELNVGERLSALDGPLAITAIEHQFDPSDVYNLEIQGDHLYRIAQPGVLVHNADYATLVTNIVDVLERYPKLIDQRTGEFIEFPISIFRDFRRIGRQANRAAELNANDYEIFEQAWRNLGLPWPNPPVQIHHIQPVEWGGDKSFKNLIPLNADTHALFSRFWDLVRRIS